MAAAAGLSHKALLPVGDAPMLVRVLRTLHSCPQIERVVVSGERATEMLGAYPEGRATLARTAAQSASQSVVAILDEFGPSLLVTTADHALLTPAMVSHFLAGAADDADVVAGVARASIVEAAYPETSRTWLRFRGARITGCNLFLLQTRRARSMLSFWQRVEQERKRPLAIARLIGPIALLSYACRRSTLPDMLGRLGRRAGVTLATVDMPFAEAAIDVDRPDDLALVRRIVSSRDAVTSSPARVV